MYSIIRVAKIKGWGELRAYQQHVNREKETLNADKEREHLNWTLRGDSTDISKSLKEFMAERGIEIQGTGTANQSVLCTEMLLTASPEFFKNQDGSINEEKTTRWIMENDKFLRERYGENYLFGKVHLDEISPHISAIICATTYHKKWGKEILSHKNEFGKDKKHNRLRELQTEYNKQMQKAGFKELQRGQEKSKAQHQDITAYYSKINNVKEAVEDKEIIIKQLNKELIENKELSKKDITARNTIITQLAKRSNASIKDVEQAYLREREKLDNTKVTQKEHNTTELER